MNSIFSMVGLLALIVASANAKTAPLNHTLVITQGLSNCAVPGTATALLVTGSIDPPEIPIGGSGKLNAVIDLKVNQPTDLQLDLKITKLEPTPAVIPCFDGVIGSCIYDVCSVLAKDEYDLCQLFPATLPCSCPLKAGQHTIHPVPITVPDLGEIIGNLMQGNYEGKALLYAKSKPADPVGCLFFTFKLIK